MDYRGVDYMTSVTYAPGGTNKPRGFKVGNFTVPGAYNPGVTVGNTCLSQYLYYGARALYEVRFTSKSPSTTVSVNLQNLLTEAEVMALVIPYSQTSLAVKLSYPTQILIDSTTSTFTAKVSGYSQYEQKVYSVVESTEELIGTTNQAYNFLTNIEISIPQLPEGDDEIIVAIGAGLTIELPYTDYGVPNLLDAVVSAQIDADDESFNSVPLIAFKQQEDLLVPSFNLVYQPATWNIDVVSTLGNPRPLILPNPDKPLTDFYRVFFSQLVYPTDNLPNLLNANITFSSDNLVNTIGIPNYSEGWKGWAE